MGQARAVKVRYTKRALAQIDEVLTYIEAHSAQGAIHVRDRIVALIALLEAHPYAGDRPHAHTSVACRSTLILI